MLLTTLCVVLWCVSGGDEWVLEGASCRLAGGHSGSALEVVRLCGV